MAEPKGFHLFVNLSAANAKKRLKGFGHGVRKIQSAGKNQAVITHTATDRHLDELNALFEDVGSADRYDNLSAPIENLRNLGQESGQWLRAVGILTVAQLEDAGAVLAFRLVKKQRRKVSLNLLWAMAAGLQDRDWRDLTADEKQRLTRLATDD